MWGYEEALMTKIMFRNRRKMWKNDKQANCEEYTARLNEAFKATQNSNCEVLLNILK